MPKLLLRTNWKSPTFLSKGNTLVREKESSFPLCTTELRMLIVLLGHSALTTLQRDGLGSQACLPYLVLLPPLLLCPSCGVSWGWTVGFNILAAYLVFTTSIHICVCGCKIKNSLCASANRLWWVTGRLPRRLLMKERWSLFPLIVFSV